MSENNTLISHFYIEFAEAPGHGDKATAAETEFMHDVLEIVVDNSLYFPDVATILVHDPHLKWVDDKQLNPGRPVRILAKRQEPKAEKTVIFEGEVVELESAFEQSSHQLTVRAFDRLHRLARGRHVRTFQNTKDSDVASQIAREVKLKTDIKETRAVHEHLFQNNKTNLEFLRERAHALGYLLFVSGDKLCFKPPAQQPQPIELQWGVTLGQFCPRLTTIGQHSKIVVRGWDIGTRQEVRSEADNGDGTRDIQDDKHKKSGGHQTEEGFNLKTTYLVTGAPVRTQSEADHLARVIADREAERFIEAEGTCGGNPAIVAGASVKIKAVGERFSGTYFVTATTHTYNSHEGYLTHFSISGQTPISLLRLLRGSDEEQSLHPATSLVIGIVTDNQDPKGLGRVKVKYPQLSGEHTSDWARVVTVGAGPQRGLQFTPEVNDEVLVGFEMGNIHYPYVIGGLWNGRDGPPTGKGQGQIILQDKSGNKIAIDGNSNSLILQDKSGNKIAINGNSNSLEIDVKGEVNIKGSVINLN